MNIRTLVINGIIAALYVAVSLLVSPVAFGAIQFRISEMFNHLIIFDKRYFFGITIGVFASNLFSMAGGLDLLFGTAHTAISLGIIIFLKKYIKNKLTLLFLNTLIFSFNMFIIAFMLNIALQLPFLLTWLTTGISELIVLLIGIPIFYTLYKRIHFDKMI
ncbi:membrane protein [Oceanobacillus oncorhynchi subsp. incaldanensis]|uniref:Queuosine transporter QueT n=2 Tax=Oceanobacillus TaxID=182709 RepID=A0A0A1MAG0_9BACI|nr:QueT transporter family protein [Oceanobacillus oncorhynchi]MDM8100335.1 QueT transporter family protein [Oceanobacillus oncorhynchi]UUI40852.1 QueT transporter family protein [Oceanobacillus oncorhynchi]GIO18717.1 membrane protein [Oceanobacillus oncorhynchi subsp. incaldanensis]CEI82290.1 Queuosine precursor transporter QueT [Oceanobacillus oncorhynchi]